MSHGKAPSPRNKSKLNYDKTSWITLDQFNSILLTETEAEFGIPQFSSLGTSESQWEASIENEWIFAEKEEASGYMNGRRRVQRGKPPGYLPFVVCDTSGRNGERCMRDIEVIFEELVIPIYNKRNMSCFVLESLPSIVRDLPSHLLSLPLSVEMKLQKGLVDLISDIDDRIPGSHFQITGMFCAGETNSKADGLHLAEDIIETFSDYSERKLRQDTFLHGRTFRHWNRNEFWHRQLQSQQQDDVVVDQECQNILQQMHLEVSLRGDMMMLAFPRTKELVPCLHPLLIDLAMQPEICFVGGRQDVEPLNIVASGVVQSGDKDSKPFHDVGLDGNGQIVAVSDSGLDMDNCYLWDSSHSVSKDTNGTTDLSARKVIQYYAYADDKDSYTGHGTHVAATIAGRKAEDGATESDGHDGIAKAAKISFFDIGDGDESTLKVPDDMFAIFDPGYKAGARIHSASWGVPNNQYTAMDFAIDAYVYSNPDFLFVTAVGNLGFFNRPNTVGSPAICKNGIAVGSNENAAPHTSEGMRGPDYLASFSSRGPTADGRLAPQVVAPGSKIKSAQAIPDMVGECDDTIPEGLTFKTGTSMSAPVVAGAAALVRQYFVEGWYPDGRPKSSSGFNPTASLVKAVLINGGQRLYGIESEFGTVNYTQPYDGNQGFGRIDLLQALPLADKNTIRAIAINSQAIGNGEHHEYEVINNWSHDCTEPLSATLVWTDPIGAPFCGECVLNDLDLYITKRGDNHLRLHPNGRNSPDDKNNAERVRIINPEDGGIYTVHVEGTELIETQQYSLIITGCLYEKREGSPGPPISSWTPKPTISPVPIVVSLPSSSPVNDNCADGPGKINVSSDRQEDCDWLGRNPYMYGFLCEFIDVAKECPHTCGKCDVIDSIPVGNNRVTNGGFDGEDRWYGNRFDIQALKDITITGIEIHVNREGEFDVEIYTRPGSLSDLNNGNWETASMICNTRVQAQGVGAATVIPPEAFTSVTIDAGQSQTFYVTLQEPDLLMVLEGTLKSNTAVFENTDLVVGSGEAVSYFDGKAFPNYSWNGRLQYELSTEDPSPPCKDNNGNVLVNNYIGSKSCQWLANNLDRVRHVCSYVHPALHCPRTCGICDT